MQHADLLINARWMLPISPKNCVLNNHAIAIKNGRIIGIMPLTEAQENFYAEQYLELKDHVLMPGLVNAHTHSPMNLFRGLADDLNLMDWLNNHIWPAEKALINESNVALGSLIAIAEMIRGGTTCFSDHYFFPESTAKVVLDTGIRAALGHFVAMFPTAFGQNEDDYIKKAITHLESKSNDPLITWMLAPHSPYGNSDKGLIRIKELSEQYQLPVHIHMHETQIEIENSLKEYKVRPLARFKKLGLLNSRLINVHMVALTDEEIEWVSAAQSHVVHSPESNLKLASGFAPVSKLIDAGVNVAIGTDGAASNNDLDMFGELRTTALIQKALTKDPTCLPADLTLKMATLNGAKALHLDKEIGSLEIGKSADIIAVHLNDFFSQPVYNPMSHLVYAANRLQVSDVWVAGKQLLKNGQFTQLEIEPLIEKAQAFTKKAMQYKSGHIFTQNISVTV